MIQEIAPRHLENHYAPRSPRPEDPVLCFREGALCVRQGGGEIVFPVCAVLPPQALEGCRYLFSIGEEAYFLSEPAQPPGCEYLTMQAIRGMGPRERLFAAETGWHLYQWYRTNRFCGACGRPMAHDGAERMLRCPACGNMVFPKIAPAVIVGVTRGEELLLTRYAGRAYKRYALIAGFTEIGETAEETVAREVMEEVGLRVKNVTYYKSQPWGFESDLLLGFFAEVDGDGRITLDENELSVAEWVPWHDMPDDADGVSLTGEMMQVFKDRRGIISRAMV